MKCRVNDGVRATKVALVLNIKVRVRPGGAEVRIVLAAFCTVEARNEGNTEAASFQIDEHLPGVEPRIVQMSVVDCRGSVITNGQRIIFQGNQIQEIRLLQIAIRF